MQQIIEFAGNHWELVLALVVVSGLLVHNLTVGDKGNVTPLEAVDLINRKEAVVVDVRPTADYSKGHVLHAVNIPSNGFASQIDTLKKYKEKARPIIVACRSGAQSAHAAKLLRKAGFEEVYNLRGGILAWQSANLPVSRKKH
ncbi:MAG TPA: rhodanese-like domain-containing protein [Chromatiales bacterium]|nr:rhodanese-like domain-containing protein [Chromatiales bacterium]